MATPFFTSALNGREWSASRLGRFTPVDTAPVTHFIGGWMGPRAGLDVIIKRKITFPFLESNLGSPARRYTD
jgi:hypothetical protein